MSLKSLYPFLEPRFVFKAAAAEELEETCCSALAIAVEVFTAFCYSSHHLFLSLPLISRLFFIVLITIGTRRIDSANERVLVLELLVITHCVV